MTTDSTNTLTIDPQDFMDEEHAKPVSPSRKAWQRFRRHPLAVGGLITRIRHNRIKSGPNTGRQMARFVLEDLVGTVPVAVFADKLQEYDSLIREEAIVVVKGSARDRGAEVELNLEELVSLEQAEDELVDEFRLDLSTRMSTGKMRE